MDFSDTTLTYMAATFELGTPLILLIVSFMKPKYRWISLPMLGALIPALVFMAMAFFGYYFDDQEANRFAFLAMWILGFYAYCFLLLFGFVFSFVLKRLQTKSAFAFCACVPTLFILFFVYQF